VFVGIGVIELTVAFRRSFLAEPEACCFVVRVPLCLSFP